jgi:hypothetical protein
MGWFNKLRDAVETAAVVGGNYFLPGSSIVTSQLVSKGSQKQLGSDFGRVANLAAGGYGGYEGNLANWGAGANAIGDYTGLNSLFSSGGAAAVPEAGAATSGSTTANLSAGIDTGTTAAVPTVDPTSMTANTASPALTQSTVSQGSNIPSYGTADAGNYGYDMGTGTAGPATVPDAFADESLAESTRLANQNTMASGVPVGTSEGFLPSLMNGNLGAAASSAGNYMMDNKLGTAMVGSSLYDMYAKKQMAKRQEDLYNQNRNDILNMYAPGSPEAIAMEQALARKDAAAGRNSQYGARAADFAANVAKFRSNALSNLASGQNALSAAQMGNQYGGLNSMFNNLAMYSLLNKKTT